MQLSNVPKSTKSHRDPPKKQQDVILQTNQKEAAWQFKEQCIYNYGHRQSKPISSTLLDTVKNHTRKMPLYLNYISKHKQLSNMSDMQSIQVAWDKRCNAPSGLWGPG